MSLLFFGPTCPATTARRHHDPATIYVRVRVRMMLLQHSYTPLSGVILTVCNEVMWYREYLHIFSFVYLPR